MQVDRLLVGLRWRRLEEPLGFIKVLQWVSLGVLPALGKGYFGRHLARVGAGKLGGGDRWAGEGLLPWPAQRASDKA